MTSCLHQILLVGVTSGLWCSSSCLGSECDRLVGAAEKALTRARLREAKHHLEAAMADTLSTRCLERAIVLAAAIGIGELGVQKTLAYQAAAALENASLPQSEYQRWDGLMTRSILLLEERLDADFATYAKLCSVERRFIRWDVPAPELVSMAQRLLDQYERPIENLTTLEWHAQFSNRMFQQDYALLLMMTSVNEYWNPTTQMLDVAGAMSDLGTTLLFVEDHETAEFVYTQVLELTEGDSTSRWRSHALHGIKEAKRRRALTE